MRFESAAQCQRFVSNHGPILNVFLLHRENQFAADYRTLRTEAMPVSREITLPSAI
jgi:putative transposase